MAGRVVPVELALRDPWAWLHAPPRCGHRRSRPPPGLRHRVVRATRADPPALSARATRRGAECSRTRARPLHPYSQGLLGAFPSLHGPKVRLVGIPGSPPDLASPPAGCRFAPRCPRAEPRCTAAEVPLYSVNGSLVRCVLQEPAR